MADALSLHSGLEPDVAYRVRRPWETKKTELSTREKREARAFLFGYFGQKKCFVSGKPIIPQLLHAGGVDIHHLLELGREGCNLLPNLRLAYHGPNASAGHPRKGIPRIDKDGIPPDPTTQLRQVIDYSRGPVEMQVNADAEPTYRGLMWEHLLFNNRITKNEAIFGMAERIGVSPQATRDYLGKTISEAGPFKEIKENGIKYIIVKPGRLD